MARSQNDYKTANSSILRPAIQAVPSECHEVARCTRAFNFIYGYKKSTTLPAANFMKLINAQ